MKGLFYIEESELDKLRAVATRLYREERLTGDDMRDLAHTITGVVRAVTELEVPDSERE